MKDKKGVSGVVTVVILIALVIAMAAIVWTVVDKLVKEKLGSAESCLNIYDKISINRVYTCYSKTVNELQVSVNIGDIELEELLISISGEGVTKSLKIPIKAGEPESNYVKNLGDTAYGGDVNLPGENAGRTYVIDLSNTNIGFTREPDSIKIAPIINGEQCREVDSVMGIDPCDIIT